MQEEKKRKDTLAFGLHTIYKNGHPKLKLIVAHLFGLEILIEKNYKDQNLYFDIATVQITSTKRLRDAMKFAGASNVIHRTNTLYEKDNLKKNIDRIINWIFQPMKKY